MAKVSVHRLDEEVGGAKARDVQRSYAVWLKLCKQWYKICQLSNEYVELYQTPFIQEWDANQVMMKRTSDKFAFRDIRDIVARALDPSADKKQVARDFSSTGALARNVDKTYYRQWVVKRTKALDPINQRLEDLQQVGPRVLQIALYRVMVAIKVYEASVPAEATRYSTFYKQLNEYYYSNNDALLAGLVPDSGPMKHSYVLREFLSVPGIETLSYEMRDNLNVAEPSIEKVEIFAVATVNLFKAQAEAEKAPMTVGQIYVHLFKYDILEIDHEAEKLGRLERTGQRVDKLQFPYVTLRNAPKLYPENSDALKLAAMATEPELSASIFFLPFVDDEDQEQEQEQDPWELMEQEWERYDSVHRKQPQAQEQEQEQEQEQAQDPWEWLEQYWENPELTKQQQAQAEAQAQAQAQELKRAQTAKELERERAQAEALAKEREQAQARDLAQAQARWKAQEREKAKAEALALALSQAQERERAQAEALAEAQQRERAQAQALAEAQQREQAQAQALAEVQQRERAQALALAQAQERERAQALALAQARAQEEDEETEVDPNWMRKSGYASKPSNQEPSAGGSDENPVMPMEEATTRSSGVAPKRRSLRMRRPNPFAPDQYVPMETGMSIGRPVDDFIGSLMSGGSAVHLLEIRRQPN